MCNFLLHRLNKSCVMQVKESTTILHAKCRHANDNLIKFIAILDIAIINKLKFITKM